MSGGIPFIEIISLRDQKNVINHAILRIYPLAHVYMADGKILHAINGKTHYFDWAILNSYFT